MITAEARYFSHAHRISDIALDASVATLYDGQWLMLNSAGKWIISDGSKKSYITLSSKYGTFSTSVNAPITMGVSGRDTITGSGLATVLEGAWRLSTDQWDTTQTFNTNDNLKIANGIVTKWGVTNNNNAAANLIGVFSPTALPTLAATTGGSIAFGTVVFVRYSYTTASGETFVSPEQSVTLSSPNNAITVTGATLPTNANGIKVYVSTASGAEVFAGSSGTNAYTLTALPAASAAVAPVADKPELIVGWVYKVPASSTDTVGIVHE